MIFAMRVKEMESTENFRHMATARAIIYCDESLEETKGRSQPGSTVVTINATAQTYTATA
jgi:hypothetical protein